MADGVWKGGFPNVSGCSRQLSLKKISDPGTPSMRKVDNGGNREEKKHWKIML